jgi:biopolymer transport protein ExbD
MFKPPKPTNMDLNLAPMVDVMMCLIIFFLLAAKLVSAEHFKVDLPWAAAAQIVDSHELGARVTISIRKAADDGTSAEYVVADWDGERITERVLPPDGVEGLLRARKKRAEQDKQELRCVIRADQDVEYQHVEVVLRACGLAKVSKVVFSANKLEREGAGGSG